jgi:hypothetical protein
VTGRARRRRFGSGSRFARRRSSRCRRVDQGAGSAGPKDLCLARDPRPFFLAAAEVANALEAPDLRPEMTVQELVDEFLEQYDREPGSVATLTANLKHVTAKFGDKRIDRLPVSELRAWPKRLSPGTRWLAVKAFRQILNYALECGYVAENAAKKIPNPEPNRAPVEIFTRPRSTRSRPSSDRRCP